jgi:Lon protease-like protein
MFPLGTTLLPYAGLPLRVFELRYLELVRDCVDRDEEFGSVLIERGSEVGGGDARFGVGTMARILEVREDPRGFLRVLAVGVRRVRVRAWLDDDPYPRAEIDDWPDPAPTGAVAALLAEATAKLRRTLALVAELGGPAAPATIAFDDDPLVAGYQLARVAPVGELDRLALLSAPTPEDRLVLLREQLADTEALLVGRLQE